MPIFPVTGNGHLAPSTLGTETFCVLEYVRDNGWQAVCFVTGVSNKGEARDAAAEWLGRGAALMATRVGGTSGIVEVVEEVPPPPQTFTVREWDEARDEG